jgi:hypothetical protein
MSWKSNYIARWGKEKYVALLAQHRAHYYKVTKEHCERSRKWWKANPVKVRAYHKATNSKAGKFYKKTQLLKSTGIQGERHKIRVRHAHRWRKYKNIIAPESQIHHMWRDGTSEYYGVALVEKDQHMHGIINVILILEGEIAFNRE